VVFLLKTEENSNRRYQYQKWDNGAAAQRYHHKICRNSKKNCTQSLQDQHDYKASDLKKSREKFAELRHWFDAFFPQNQLTLRLSLRPQRSLW